jgi:hypothetical protein
VDAFFAWIDERFERRGLLPSNPFTQARGRAELGRRCSSEILASGCVGMYHLPDRSIPDGAMRDSRYRVVVPNEDPLDAFSR